ncbi:uncharacterized protein TRIADDRAFT_58696 [Trichoplax adhaerens]|uniref:LIM zinc-binding domain-containing protein n=1 Tax=Trichoplax adhaerens TaxID=10228 RepID=B3S3F2_TRIAD|nr:hypothetical protein TRIADDRAFT_58696 [Trichoplax adhaerens]EDV22781.1 hypothetical protein TRIADDRAFT_58696 [Trichoplax adhaerens]|eukprot:XP_002114647.1 hypothetical protein TRIADDRAFT_58696 [Trichoplax adhaerens]
MSEVCSELLSQISYIAHRILTTRVDVVDYKFTYLDLALTADRIMGVLYQKKLSYRHGQHKQSDNSPPVASATGQVLNFTTTPTIKRKQGNNYKRTGRLVTINVGYYAKNEDQYYTYRMCHPETKELCFYCHEYLENQAVEMNKNRYHLECFDEYILSKISDGLQTTASSDQKSDTVSSMDYVMKNFLSKCGGCQKEIEDYHGIFALEQQWHPSCFKCHHCGKLLNEDYAGRNRKPYCLDDFRQLFGVFCTGCQHYIDGEFLEIGENNFHTACAVCIKCKKPFLEEIEAVVINDKLWHKECQYLEDDDTKRSLPTATRAEVSSKLESPASPISKPTFTNLVVLRCASTEQLQNIGQRGRTYSDSAAFSDIQNPSRCRTVTINGRVMLGNRDGSCSPSSSLPDRQISHRRNRISDPVSSTSLVEAIATPPSRRRLHSATTSSTSSAVKTSLILHKGNFSNSKSQVPTLQSSPLSQRKTSMYLD